MRKNHIKCNDARIDLNKFDRVYIDLPEAANTARIVAVPLKVIYYNANANASNLDRVYYDIDELAEFMDACGVSM